MKRIMGRGLTVFIFLMMLFLSGCGDIRKNTQAVDGLLDLSSWDVEKNEITYLDGSWEFYWGRLLTPNDFDAENLPQKTGYFSTPGYWNGYTVNGKPLSGEGCATLRLKVRLKQGIKDLSLRVEEESTAYRLWVNGSLVMTNGVVGASAGAMKPYKKIVTAYLPDVPEYLDCILQVSNFYMHDGGPYRKIAIGPPDAINKRQAWLFATDLLLFGILGIIGVYHLVFYILRRKDASLLYFGFFCLCWSIGIPFGATSGKFITMLFPGFPWYWQCRMELLTWFPVVPLVMMFFQCLYPHEFSRMVTRSAQTVATVFFLYVIIAPSRLIGYTAVPYQAFSLVILVYTIAMLYSAVRYRRSGAALMLTGIIIFIATVINDSLYMNMVIYSVYLVSFGVAVMILIQSFALARLLAQSFSAVETLTAELEKKNVALSQLDKLKDEFLANTSHELRTPLNGIIGIAESLKSGIAGRLPARAHENLAMIAASGKRLAGLINDILDFSRLKSRDIRLHRKTVDMRVVVETVLTVMTELTTGKDIALINDIPKDLPQALGDEDRLQQILYNLVGNAIKFTDHGEIRVSAGLKDSMMEVSVKDEGIGMPEDKHEDVFKPFEQADSSNARIHGGAGLGLSITKQLVELHGGNIRVQSKPGEGAVFSFSIPVVQNGSTELPEIKDGDGFIPVVPLEPIFEYEPEENMPGFNNGITILAVDDDPVNLQVVSNHLSFKNVSVITAPSGTEAVKLIERGLMPDLMLLDIMMPVMTGYEVSKWLRQRYTASELPIIILTAKNGPDDLKEGFNLGANDYLVKPFVRDELLARVTSQLKLKESYLTLRENKALRKELEERKQVERELRFMQQSLSLMLDKVDETMLAVNEDEEITFCNKRCEDLLAYSAHELLGKPFFSLTKQESFSEEKKNAIKQCIISGENLDLGAEALIRADGDLCEVHVYLSALRVEDDSLCLMILRNKMSGRPEGAAARKIEQSLGIIEAINSNRLRLQNIKDSLNGLFPLIIEKEPGFLKELNAIDEALDNAGRSLLSDQDFESRRHLAVEVMTCALEYWTEATGLTKAQLAHQSRLWKVYTNLDGWERTQTLDKYLKIDTFPVKPLWLKIFKTAEFVLANAEKPSAQRTRLEMLLAKLRISK
jgi:two-component system, sensor histidine kinase ChiS